LSQALSPDEFRTVMKVVESAILSTDLAMYFKKRDKFSELIENGEFDWQSEEKKESEYKLILLPLLRVAAHGDTNKNYMLPNCFPFPFPPFSILY
jgi:hypothetical protein